MLREKNVCPECGGTLIRSGFEVVCSNCGLIVSTENFDRGPEWRAFTLEEKLEKSRVGAPLNETHVDRGLSTEIGEFRDAYGRRVSAKGEAKARRLKMWQKRVRMENQRERNLLQATVAMTTLAEKLNLPREALEEASILYRKLLENGSVRGRSIAYMAAASIYAVLRRRGLPRTLDELAKASGLKKKDLARCYRIILKEADIQPPVPDPRSYIPKIVSKLGLPLEVEMEALKILSENSKSMAGRSPHVLASAAVYCAAKRLNHTITQRQAADAVGVTEVSIRNGVKAIEEIYET